MDHLWSSSGVQLLVGLLLLWITQGLYSPQRYIPSGYHPFGLLSDFSVALAMCPPSFIDFEGRCYHFSSNTFNSRELAVAYCRTFDNGKLDVPRKPEENDFFRQRIDGIPAGMPGAWIEPTDDETENVWKCGHDVCNYFNWRPPSEPNGGKSSNCVVMFVSDGRWGDNECNDPDDAWHAVCKIDMHPPPDQHLPPEECPADSIQHQSHCYHFTLETFRTRRDAQDHCRDVENGRLYTPEGPSDNDFILENMGDIDEDEAGIWLDASDGKNEGVWECGKYPCHYLNWDPAMDHANGGSLDCAIMEGVDGYWIHHPCDHSNELFHAVCKSDLQSSQGEPVPRLECPTDSVHYQDHCYHFTLETFPTRQGARDYCRDFENGRLFTPRGPIENDFILENMEDIDEDEAGIWLNADDEKKEGAWECGRDPCHYLNWDPVMDHASGGSLDCAIMEGVDGYWIHYPCDHGNELFHAVCESDPVEIQTDKDSTTKHEEMTSRSTTTAELTTTNRPTTLKTTTIELTTDVVTTTALTTPDATTRSTIKPITTEQTTKQKPTTHVTTTEAQTTRLASSSKPATTVVTTDFTTTIQTTPVTTTIQTTPVTTTIQTTPATTTLQTTPATTTIQTTPATTTIQTTPATTTIQTTPVTTTIQTTPATTTIQTTPATTTIQTTTATTTLQATTILTTSESMILEETTTEIQTTRSGLLGGKKQLNCSHVVDIDTMKSNYSSYVFQRTESFNSPKRVLENSSVLSSSIMCAVSCLKRVKCSAILLHNADGNGVGVCELLGESLEGINEVSLYDGVTPYLKLICF